MQTPNQQRSKRLPDSPLDNPVYKMAKVGDMSYQELAASLMSEFAMVLNKTLDDRLREKLDPILAALEGVKQEVECLQGMVSSLEHENFELKDKLRQSEDRDRRQNLRFVGFPLVQGENCFQSVTDFCCKTLGLEKVSINRAHRISKSPGAAIIANFIWDGEVQSILQASRPGAGMSSNLCSRTSPERRCS